MANRYIEHNTNAYLYADHNSKFEGFERKL